MGGTVPALTSAKNGKNSEIKETEERGLQEKTAQMRRQLQGQCPERKEVAKGAHSGNERKTQMRPQELYNQVNFRDNCWKTAKI